MRASSAGGRLAVAQLGQVADLPQAPQVVLADALRRACGGEGLEQLAHLEQVDEVLGVERAHDRAAVWRHLHEPFALEDQQRLADRRPRRAEARGERLGLQALGRLELPGEDRVAHLGGHAQRARRRAAVNHRGAPGATASDRVRPWVHECVLPCVAQSISIADPPSTGAGIARRRG